MPTMFIPPPEPERAATAGRQAAALHVGFGLAHAGDDDALERDRPFGLDEAPEVAEAGLLPAQPVQHPLALPLLGEAHDEERLVLVTALQGQAGPLVLRVEHEQLDPLVQPATLLRLQASRLLRDGGLLCVAFRTIDHDRRDGVLAEQAGQPRPKCPLIRPRGHPVEHAPRPLGPDLAAPHGIAPARLAGHGAHEQHRAALRVECGPAALAGIGRLRQHVAAIGGPVAAAMAGGGHRNLVVGEISSNVGPSALAEVE